MKCVILAGGKGTRIASEYPNIPKSLIPICKTPVLEHEIDALRSQGISEIILVTGYLHEDIEYYFSDGSKFGVQITYYREKTPLGTAGALFDLELTDDFLLCSGDIIFDFSVVKMMEFHKSKNALATIFTHPNSHPFDSTLIRTDGQHRIIGAFKAPVEIDSFTNNCSAGIYILTPEILEINRQRLQGKKCDIDRDLLFKNIDCNRLYSYKSSEYVFDIGTPERVKEAEKYIESQKESCMNAATKNKAVFIDRDGTLNVYKGYITHKKDIELTENAEEAIKIFHSLGYLVIVITNQPAVARGECTLEDISEINGRIEYLLGMKKTYVDDFFVCPHHPDKGFKNENPKFKIDCFCRKPKPGMILEAAKKYSIDIKNSFMVGDSQTDIKCAENAGCIPIFIENKRESALGTVSFKNLFDFANWLHDQL